MFCQHYYDNEGKPAITGPATRCGNIARVRIVSPDGQSCGFLCQDHADACVSEYADKLGETWTLHPIDSYEIKCDDCKRAIGITDSQAISARGGRCWDCRCQSMITADLFRLKAQNIGAASEAAVREINRRGVLSSMEIV